MITSKIARLPWPNQSLDFPDQWEPCRHFAFTTCIFHQISSAALLMLLQGPQPQEWNSPTSSVPWLSPTFRVSGNRVLLLDYQTAVKLTNTFSSSASMSNDCSSILYRGFVMVIDSPDPDDIIITQRNEPADIRATPVDPSDFIHVTS